MIYKSPEDILQCVHAVQATLLFPEGFYSGASGKDGNYMQLARDGKGNPVLRGSALAGLLRSAMGGLYGKIESWFGYALGDSDERYESRFVFEDATFSVDNQSEETMHNLICRHTGAVSEADKGLFSIERIPAGSSCQVFFYLKGKSEDYDKDSMFVRQAASALHGMLIGGNSNRGCGRAVLLNGEFAMQSFDLSKLDDAAAFADVMYSADRKLPASKIVKAESLRDAFVLEVTLGIPRGQDLLCAEGNEMSPVFAVKGDGKRYWKIPGSSFRGVFRGWFNRLAAREGWELTYPVDEYQKNPNKAEKDMKPNEEDPVAELFGTLHGRGRIHFSDAYSDTPCLPEEDLQPRSHVVIDRFTGGTNDGKLFSNQVLVNSRCRFVMTVAIREAVQSDVDWLIATLRALNLGLIRIGSSKAAGRLEIKNTTVLENSNNLKFDLEAEHA